MLGRTDQILGGVQTEVLAAPNQRLQATTAYCMFWRGQFKGSTYCSAALVRPDDDSLDSRFTQDRGNSTTSGDVNRGANDQTTRDRATTVTP